MSNAKVQLRNRLRRFLSPLSETPLHPQWLVNLSQNRREKWIELRAAGETLDVGCADASIRACLTNVTRYVGLDYPPTAHGMYDTKPSVYGDARNLPIADCSFDTVMLLDVAEHLPEPSLAFQEASRVLRHGGTLLVTVPFAYPLHDQPHDYQRMTEHGLRRRMELAGFDAVVVTEIGDAVSATAASFTMAIAQGAIDAINRRHWSVVAVPVIPFLILWMNITGWLASRLIPAWNFMPGGYYAQAKRPQ